MYGLVGWKATSRMLSWNFFLCAVISWTHVLLSKCHNLIEQSCEPETVTVVNTLPAIQTWTITVFYNHLTLSRCSWVCRFEPKDSWSKWINSTLKNQILEKNFSVKLIIKSWWTIPDNKYNPLGSTAKLVTASKWATIEWTIFPVWLSQNLTCLSSCAVIVNGKVGWQTILFICLLLRLTLSWLDSSRMIGLAVSESKTIQWELANAATIRFGSSLTKSTLEGIPSCSDVNVFNNWTWTNKKYNRHYRRLAKHKPCCAVPTSWLSHRLNRIASAVWNLKQTVPKRHQNVLAMLCLKRRVQTNRKDLCWNWVCSNSLSHRLSHRSSSARHFQKSPNKALVQCDSCTFRYC